MKQNIMKETWKQVLLLGICLLMVVTVVFLPFGRTAAAAAPKVVVNGRVVVFPDAQPFVDSNNRTQVPVRFVAESLNAKVGWDQASRTVTISRGPVVVKMVIGEARFTANDVPKPMDTASLLKDSRTFVPLRFISEALGATVTWEAATSTAYITDSGDDVYVAGDFKIPISDADKIDGDMVRGILIMKQSGLMIEGGGDDIGSVNLMIDIRIDRKDSDVPTQRTETQAILSSFLSDAKTTEVMDYINKKQKSTDTLDMKEFTEGKYAVVVSSSYDKAISILLTYEI